jgi:hypothetical protein
MKKIFHSLLIVIVCIVCHMIHSNEEIKTSLLPQPTFSALPPIQWVDDESIVGVYNRNLEIASNSFSMPYGSTRIDSKVNNVLVTLDGPVELDGSPITYTDLHFESSANCQTIIKVDQPLLFTGMTNDHPFLIEKTNGSGTVSWEISCQLSFIPFSE